MKIEMRKAEVLGDFKSEAELANFFDVSKNISQEEIELCLSKLSDTKKRIFKEALMNMAQVDGRMTAHEDMAIKIFSDYMSWALSDGPKASHGACKLSSELRLSQEPWSTDVEGWGYAELLATMYVYALSN